MHTLMNSLYPTVNAEHTHPFSADLTKLSIFVAQTRFVSPSSDSVDLFDLLECTVFELEPEILLSCLPFSLCPALVKVSQDFNT